MAQWNNVQKWCVHFGDDENADLKELQAILWREGIRGTPSPLHLASAGSNISIINLLIKNRAIINSKDRIGSTPLHWACANGNIPVIKVLIENKADVTFCDKDGNTPLHYAVEKGHLETVQYLIEEHNVDFECKNKKQQTPLAIAIEEEEKLIIRYLIGKGSSFSDILFTHMKNDNIRVVKNLLKSTKISQESFQHDENIHLFHKTIMKDQIHLGKLLLKHAPWLSKCE